MSARFLFPMALILFAIAMPAIGRFAYDYDMGVLSFPLGLAIFAVCMGLLVLRGEARGKPSSGDTVYDESEGLLGNRKAWLQMGWLALFIGASIVLGFLIGPSLALFLYLKADRHSWTVSVLSGLGAALVIWVMFILALQTPLPTTPIFLG